MCKEMMEQRNKIEEMLNIDMERCLKNIRNTGACDAPTVMVDMEKLFIANREYFERQRFFFEPDTRVEKQQVRYYAWLKLGGKGEMGNSFWKKIHEAKEDYMIEQRKKILNRLKVAEGGCVCVNLRKLLFENKMFFEASGYAFEPYTRMESDKVHYFAWIKKRT